MNFRNDSNTNSAKKLVKTLKDSNSFPTYHEYSPSYLSHPLFEKEKNDMSQNTQKSFTFDMGTQCEGLQANESVQVQVACDEKSTEPRYRDFSTDPKMADKAIDSMHSIIENVNSIQTIDHVNTQTNSYKMKERIESKTFNEINLNHLKNNNHQSANNIEYEIKSSINNSNNLNNSINTSNPNNQCTHTFNIPIHVHICTPNGHYHIHPEDQTNLNHSINYNLNTENKSSTDPSQSSNFHFRENDRKYSTNNLPTSNEIICGGQLDSRNPEDLKSISSQTINILFKELLQILEYVPIVSNIEDIEEVENIKESNLSSKTYTIYKRKTNNSYENEMQMLQLSKKIMDLEVKKPMIYQISPHKSNLSEVDKELLRHALETQFTLNCGSECTKDKLLPITIQAFELPFFFNDLLFNSLKKGDLVYKEDLLYYFDKYVLDKPPQNKFFAILKDPHLNSVTMNDLQKLIHHIVHQHPTFHNLIDKVRNDIPFTRELIVLYKEFVRIRMFHDLNVNQNGRITLLEFTQSHICDAMDNLSLPTADVDDEKYYFSLKHFIVFFTQFQSLKEISFHENNSLEESLKRFYLNIEELETFKSRAITRSMISQIYNKTQKFLKSLSFWDLPLPKFKDPTNFSFREFVYFMLCNYLKFHTTSLEYWFQLIDIEDRGYINIYDLYSFLEEQIERMHNQGLTEISMNGLIQLILKYFDIKIDTNLNINQKKSISIHDHQPNTIHISFYNLLNGQREQIVNALNLIFNLDEFLLFSENDLIFEQAPELFDEEFQCLCLST